MVTTYSQSLPFIFTKVRSISRDFKNAKGNTIKKKEGSLIIMAFFKTIESSYFIKASNTKHPEIVNSWKMEISMKKDMHTDLKLEN